MARRRIAAAAAGGNTARRCRLLRPFGYVDAEGRHRRWPLGADIAGDDLADLEARGAPLSELPPPHEEQ